MLCEGVMLYMMLVTVFGNKLNRRLFFFILGWGEHKCTEVIVLYNYMIIFTLGPAIPIVAISAGIVHRHYGTDD